MRTELVSETIGAGLRCDNAIDALHGGKRDWTSLMTKDIQWWQISQDNQDIKESDEWEKMGKLFQTAVFSSHESLPRIGKV